MKAAFYECDVTPPLGDIMFGNAKPTYATDVVAPLYAKALVVEDAGEAAAIMVVDICQIPTDMHDIVTKRIYEYTGIPAEKVCITSNHTHEGAPAGNDPVGGGHVDPAYEDVFYRRCADAVILAYKRLDDVEIKYGTSYAPGIAFCRDFLLKDGRMFTHGRRKYDLIERPISDPDESLPIVMFERNGESIGAIINFACHQDTASKVGYSGDYSSVLSDILKEKYGHNFVSFFLLGPCGDVGHVDPNPEHPIQHAPEIARKLSEYFENSVADLKPVTEGGVKSVKEYVDVNRRYFDDQSLLAEVTRIATDPNLGNVNRIKRMMTYVNSNPPASTPLPVQCIKIGDVLIVCLPGEIYSAFGKRIKEASPYDKVILVEQSNYGCGYIPVKEAFVPNCYFYETSLAPASCFAPDAGDVLTKKAIEIIKKI